MTGTSSPTDSGALYLLRIEGQNFGSVIFDTHDLSTIAGGSRLLEMAPQRIKELLEIPPGVAGVKAVRTIQCAASTGLFALRAESKDIASILQAVKGELAESPYCHLTVSVEAIECPEVTANADKDGKYTIQNEELKNIPIEKLDQLQAAARFAQMRASNVAIPKVSPNAARACSVDRVRPADGKGNRAMSASVAARREEGKQFRWKSGTKKIATVRTFEEMTEHKEKRLDGRLAVISIDGKGFTKLRGRLCRNFDDQRWFSDQLATLQTGFFEKLLNEWKDKTGDSYNYFPKSEDLQEGETSPWLRLQRLMSAGDDAVYLMPAWLAWEFLTKFFTGDWKLNPETEDQRAAILELTSNGEMTAKGLSFRARVVICSAKAPIHPIRDLAHQLESEIAKNDTDSDVKNPVAYEILKSFDFIGPSKLRGYREKRRTDKLNAADLVLEGSALAAKKDQLIQLDNKYSSAEIKNPKRWPKGEEAGAYHLSQWKDYIDLEGERP